MILAARLSLGCLLGSLLALTPAAARGVTCQNPVRFGDVVSWINYDQLHRFDLATGTRLPSVTVYFGIEEAWVDGDTIWVRRSSTLEALHPTGARRFQVASDRSVWDAAQRDGHVFVLSSDPLVADSQTLRSYDAATGALESETGPTSHFSVVAVPGRVVLHTGSRFDAVTYDAAGVLGAVSEVYPEQTFESPRFELAGDGAHLVSQTAIFDAATLDVVSGYEERLPTAWGDRRVGVDRRYGLRLYDAAQSLVGGIPDVSPHFISGLFPVGDALWVFRCLDEFERLELDDFAPPTLLPPPLRVTSFTRNERSRATSEEGVLYFTMWQEEPHVRRWLPEENRFLDSIPLREPPLHVVRAPGGGVFVTHPSGRVGRIERGGEVEVPFVFMPTHFASSIQPPIPAGPWTVFNDGYRWHSFGPDGRWRSSLFEPQSSRNLGAVWDEARSRLIWLEDWSNATRTFAVDGEGRLTPGPDGPAAFEYPLAASTAGKLYAGSWIADLETLQGIADLQLPDWRYPRGLWSNDTLVTVLGEYWGPTDYREWTADGAPRTEASATLPGGTVDLLPFDEARVLLVQYFEDDLGARDEYRLVTIGGDLDSDGIANADDDYPLDPARYSDRDGDGVDDAADAFPDDPAETADGDGDGLGDVADHLPDFGAERVARLSGEDWVRIAGLGRSSRDVEAQLHVFADGSYAFCTARETCLGGTWQTLRGERGLGLTVSRAFLDGFAQSIRAGLARDLSRKVGFRFLARSARGKVRTDEQGAVRFTLRAPHRGYVAGFGAFAGAYSIRAEGEWLELAPPAP